MESKADFQLLGAQCRTGLCYFIEQGGEVVDDEGCESVLE